MGVPPEPGQELPVGAQVGLARLEKGENKMKKNRGQATFEVLAALLVLFTTMLDPRVSIVLAIIALLALAAYNWFSHPHKQI